MKVAIVILNWNGERMLRQYLPCVVENSGSEAEVIVADNASTDGSLQYIQQGFPDMRTIVFDKNHGFANGYNRALKQIDAEYYVLLNSDVRVEKGWLAPLLDFMESNKDVAACQPKLRAIVDSDSFEYAGASGGYIDKFGYPYCRGRLFDVVEKDHGQYDDAVEVHWATGACLMVRSEDYWSVGGLDGKFFAHNEEIDFCWRLRLAGRKVYCVPQSRVFHLGGGTLPKSNPMKTYLNFRNNLTMLYKNLPAKRLAWVMFVRLWLDYIAAFKFIVLDRHWGDACAVMRGRLAFLRWHSDFKPVRRNIQRTAKSKKTNIIAAYSILWQYYAKGKRLFSELPKL